MIAMSLLSALIRGSYIEPAWLTVWLTAAYVLVSLGTLLAIFRQNRSIQKTERAVLVPVWDNFVHLSHEPPPTDGPQRMHHTFNVDFRNCGKTPAFIRGITAEIMLIPSVKSLPRRPRYGPLVQFAGDPVVPNATTDYPFSSPIKDSRSFEEIESEHRKGNGVLFVRGRVIYDDIFGKRHETRYGLRYRAAPTFSHEYDCFVIDGPKAYNRYT